jgi:hypothetical protein
MRRNSPNLGSGEFLGVLIRLYAENGKQLRDSGIASSMIFLKIKEKNFQ